MSAAHDDRRWRIIAQEASATVEQRPDGKYVASTGDSFSIANTPREAVAELFDVPPCDVIDPASHDARSLAAALRVVADNLSAEIRDKPNFSVVLPASQYLQILRAFEACASGNHDESLRRFADVTNFSADGIRRMTK